MRPLSEATSPLLPVGLVIDGQRVLLVGAGRIAARKLEGLRRSGARVSVVAPEATAEIAELAEAGALRWHRRTYVRGEVASYRLAFTATGDREVDGQVFADASAAGVWVNSADDPAHCTVVLPAVARRGAVSVTISTNGVSPALASWLRRHFEDRLGPDLDALVELLAGARAELQAAGRPTEVDGWSMAFDDGLHAHVRDGDLDAAQALLRRHLGLDDHPVSAVAP